MTLGSFGFTVTCLSLQPHQGFRKEESGRLGILGTPVDAVSAVSMLGGRWGQAEHGGWGSTGTKATHGSFLLLSCVLGGGRFISLLGKIHAFCTVDLNKNGTLCTFEFRSNMRSDIFFSSAAPWGELLKLTNCVKHIIIQTNEKSRAPAVLKTSVLDFSRHNLAQKEEGAPSPNHCRVQGVGPSHTGPVQAVR